VSGGGAGEAHAQFVIHAGAGHITAIRFWKDSSETGTHTGRIWSAGGTLLASVVFTGETASGWQRRTLALPLAIAANTEYVVSVNTGNTYYVATNNGLATAVTRNSLRSIVGSNGRYGAPGQFPTQSWQASNYFRDVEFVASAPPSGSPSVAITSVSTGKAYALGIAKVDTLMFIDRTHKIISVPSAQNGGVLIRTANNDKYVNVANHLTFSVNQPSIITVAYDSRATSRPTWLNDGTWTATGTVITATDSTGPLNYRLYTKTVAAGNVTLGGNRQGVSPVAICNYVVIVKPVVGLTANG